MVMTRYTTFSSQSGVRCKYGSIDMNAKFVLAMNICFVQHIFQYGNPALPRLVSNSHSDK